MAHYRAAEFICPGVTVIDIGGQDMKYPASAITQDSTSSTRPASAVAPSCAPAQTMWHRRVPRACIMESESPDKLHGAPGTPPSLQAQAEGATRKRHQRRPVHCRAQRPHKVIKLKEPSTWASVVVQGGTFLNDSVLRALSSASTAARSCAPTSWVSWAYGRPDRACTTRGGDPSWPRGPEGFAVDTPARSAACARTTAR